MAYGIAAAAAAPPSADGADGRRRKAGDADSAQKRRKTETVELKRLEKELEDYVAANETHSGTERYEAEVASARKPTTTSMRRHYVGWRWRERRSVRGRARRRREGHARQTARTAEQQDCFRAARDHAARDRIS